MVQVISFSGVIVSGTEFVHFMKYLYGGQRVIRFVISVENTTTIEIYGIEGLNFLNQLTTGSENLTDGFVFGGDLDLEFYKFGVNLPIITGTPKIVFNQSTGANVNFSGYIVVS